MKEIPRVSTLVSNTFVLISVLATIIGVILLVRHPSTIETHDGEKISPSCVEGFLSINTNGSFTPVFIESKGVFVPIVCK